MSKEKDRELFEKILKTVNDAKLLTLHDIDEIEPFDILKPVARGLFVDKHRWFETTTDVYKIAGFFMGICGASQCYSENSSWEDLGVETVAFEMKEVKTITYEPTTE